MISNNYPLESESTGVMSPLAKLFWASAFFGLSACFAYGGDYVASILMFAAGVGAFSGFRIGALSVLTSLVTITAIIVYGPSISIQYEEKLSQLIGTTGLLNRGVCIAIGAVVISFVVWLVVHFTIGRLVRRSPSLDKANRIAGFAIGSTQGMFAVVLLVGGILVMAPLQQRQMIQAGLVESELPTVSRLVMSANKHIDESPTGKLIARFNPFEKIPQLNQIDRFQRTASVLSDPAKINEVISHPSIQQLQNSDAVREAVNTLRRDEAIQSILYSGKAMDKSAAMTLLNHPAVLKLVDQPGFVEKANLAIQEIGM